MERALKIIEVSCAVGAVVTFLGMFVFIFGVLLVTLAQSEACHQQGNKQACEAIGK